MEQNKKTKTDIPEFKSSKELKLKIKEREKKKETEKNKKNIKMIKKTTW